MQLNSIGTVKVKDEVYVLEVNEKYEQALKELKDFSHIQVIWWANGFDTEAYRNYTLSQKPYKEGPETIGLFATRSPIRPNPIMMTVCPVLSIEGSTIKVAYIDAFDQTPLLDIKPYLPCTDKVTTSESPEWASDWPDSIEASATYDWSKVFNF